MRSAIYFPWWAVLWLLLSGQCLGWTPPPGTAFVAPPEVTRNYKNQRGPKGEGSCVWFSISEAGAHAGYWPAEAITRNSPYGPAVGDGAWPERVERVFSRRGIYATNVEGRQTIAWIEWALRSGRHVPITYGQAHMICAVGMTPDAQHFCIWDNNYPGEVRWVTRDVFIREHASYGGGWCVILGTPSPPPWMRPRPPER